MSLGTGLGVRWLCPGGVAGLLPRATGASTSAVGCPFCRIMLSDGVTAAQATGQGDGVEVLDVAQLLLGGVKRGQAEPAPHS